MRTVPKLGIVFSPETSGLLELFAGVEKESRSGLRAPQDGLQLALMDVLVGTAGHIDHGKTALVKTLTGIDTDRLAEEKRRGITIDLGFAHLQLGRYRVGFVDVPGHERFVKNMLAGIGGIRLVFLVVAADESVMPQTVEHFHICRLLGIRRGIVVLTKKNNVEADLLEMVQGEVAELVAGSFLEDAPMVAVDSLSGDGIDALRETLAEVLNGLGSAECDSLARVFRLPVDRVFTLKGFGTIVTGTPASGTLAQDSRICLYPTHKLAKVRSIQIFGERGARAKAGQRTALNLVGVNKEELSRGVIVSIPEALQPSHILDAAVTLLDEAKALKSRTPVRFHHGSAELIGRVYLLQEGQLDPGATGLVQIRLDRPAVACPLDRFILRRYSPSATIAGGLVLDNQPAKHRRAELPELIPRLEAIVQASDQSRRAAENLVVEYVVQQQQGSGITANGLVARTGLLTRHLLSILEANPNIVVLPLDPPVALWEPHLRDLERRLEAFLRAHHRKHPLAGGISKQEIKNRFFRRSRQQQLDFVLKRLRHAERVEVAGSLVRIYGKSVQLSPEQEAIRRRILSLFEPHDLRAPRLQEIFGDLSPDPTKAKAVFYYLLEEGELVRVSGDLVLSSCQIDSLCQRLGQAFPQGQSFSIAEFKDLFAVTRKYAIPLLEFLDRNQITRRQGDRRIIL